MLLVSENSGIRCIKFSMIFFSVILIITGISLIIVGSTINEIYIEFSSFIDSIYFSPATLLTAVGFIIFGIACIGCLGALKESVCVITTFGVLLGATAFLQACSGMANNVLMMNIDSETEYNLNNTMIHYKSDPDAKGRMDYIQQELHCCGLNGPKDWMAFMNRVPDSCCAYYSDGHICSIAYTYGCHIVLKAIIMESSKILITSAYLLAFTEIFGMLFAFYLAKMLREQKLARDYRRWAIRNQLLSNMNYDPYFSPSNSPFYENQEKKKEGNVA